MRSEGAAKSYEGEKDKFGGKRVGTSITRIREKERGRMMRETPGNIVTALSPCFNRGYRLRRLAILAR